MIDQCVNELKNFARMWNNQYYIDIIANYAFKSKLEKYSKKSCKQHQWSWGNHGLHSQTAKRAKNLNFIPDLRPLQRVQTWAALLDPSKGFRPGLNT